LPIDPGEHRIEARAPGRISWATTVTLPPNGATLSVDVPQLGAATSSTSPLPAASPEPVPPTQPAPPEQPAPDVAAPSAAVSVAAAEPAGRWQQPLGIALGGAGVVALALGSYFGLRAMSKNSDLEKICHGPCTTVQGRDLNDQAHSAAGLANVFVIGGLALAAAGAVVYLTAPRQDSLQVALRGGASGAQIELGGNL
jgi:hypothetical protein